VRAIRERRFHVLTHPEASLGALEARLEWMRTAIEPPANPELEPWSAHPDLLRAR
jgi:hypothetical protein